MTRARAALAVVALPILLTLGGCSLIPLPEVDLDETVEEIVEGTTGGGVDVETAEVPPFGFSNATHRVLVATQADPTGDGWTVAYIVTPNT